MSEPARELEAVREANRDMHAVAAQALEWVKVSEARVAAAEGTADKIRAELKERAMKTLREMSAQARAQIAAAREAQAAAESKLAAAEAGRDRAENSFEELRRTSQAERERTLAKASEASADADSKVEAAESRAKRAVVEDEREDGAGQATV